ncbi:hypothetical protein SAMN04244548_01184 [Paracoccus pantotrophus]|nr:hypothetical protein SAMN04244548_01184 [Paracoccus pantotrophus]
MALNPSIILSGQSADILGAMQQGNALAQQVNQQRHQNALRGFLGDNAEALMQGDQNALAQYARLDPTAAFDMLGRQQDRAWREDERRYQRGRDALQDQRAAKLDARSDKEWQMKIAEYAAKKSAAEREAEAKQIEDAVKVGLAAKTPQEWDALVQSVGAPDLVGQFENRQALANRYMDVAAILKGQSGPSPLSNPGKVQADINAGLLPPDTPLQGGGQRINVSTGTVPQGYRNVYDENGNLVSQEPIPGGPADTSRQDAARQAQSARAAGIVVQDIDKAIQQVSNWTAGPGSALASIPGSGARDLQASLDTVRANIGFDRLQQMREASPTGGALGGIAIQELQMLQAVLGSLDTAQSPDQLRANLERLKQVYQPIAEKAAAYPNAAEFGFGGGASQPGGVPDFSAMSDDELADWIAKNGG